MFSTFVYKQLCDMAKLYINKDIVADKDGRYIEQQCHGADRQVPKMVANQSDSGKASGSEASIFGKRIDPNGIA